MTLRELLKPPFEIKHHELTSSHDKRILAIVNKHSFQPDILKEFEDFLTAALNEKWERDFGGKDESNV